MRAWGQQQPAGLKTGPAVDLVYIPQAMVLE